MIKPNSGKNEVPDKPIKMKKIGLEDTESSDPCHAMLVPPAPPDGGWGWVVVLSSFLIHFIVGGICYSFGIFLSPLVENFESDRGTVVWASSLASGIGMLEGKIENEATARQLKN